jgi:hypothetical protein
MTFGNTFATHLAENGASESTMLALMGHMSRAMLERDSALKLHRDEVRKNEKGFVTLITAACGAATKDSSASMTTAWRTARRPKGTAI